MKVWPTRVRIGRAAALADDLGHGLGADQVVQDRGAGLLARASPSATIAVVDRARHRLGPVVDEEHPVGVAVEGEADVGAGLERPGPAGRAGSRAGWDRRGGSGTCRRARRTGSRGRTAGPRTPRARPGRPSRWRCRPRPSAAAAPTRRRSERTWSAKAPSRSTSSTVPGSPLRRTGVLGDHRLDLAQAGVLADRLGPGQAHLDAVVLGRVVRRGEHGAGRVEAAGGEVQHVGRRQAEVDDVDALAGARPRRTPSTSSTPEGRMSRPTSTRSCRPGLAAHEPGERGADAPDDVGVELVRARCPGCRTP